jgi:hypothetical protein
MYGRYRHNGSHVLFPPKEPNWLWRVCPSFLEIHRKLIGNRMDHVIDTIMLYTFNNGALTWYTIHWAVVKQCADFFQRHHNCLLNLRA